MEQVTCSPVLRFSGSASSTTGVCSNRTYWGVRRGKRGRSGAARRPNSTPSFCWSKASATSYRKRIRKQPRRSTKPFTTDCGTGRGKSAWAHRGGCSELKLPNGTETYRPDAAAFDCSCELDRSCEPVLSATFNLGSVNSRTPSFKLMEAREASTFEGSSITRRTSCEHCSL